MPLLAPFFESLLASIMPRKRYSTIAQHYGETTLSNLLAIQSTGGCLSLMSYDDTIVRCALRALIYEHDTHVAAIYTALLKPIIDHEMLEQCVLAKLQPLVCSVPNVSRTKKSA